MDAQTFLIARSVNIKSQIPIWNIWKLYFYKSSIQMSLLCWPNLITNSDQKSLEYFLGPVFKYLLKIRPFETQTIIYFLNTRLVWYLDAHCPLFE